MSEELLKETIGGATSVSGTFINAVCKLVSTMLDLGRTIGSSLYYARNGKSCPM